MKYHKNLLTTIEEFSKPKNGILNSKNKTVSDLKASFKSHKKEFKIEFEYNISSTARRDLDVGQYHKNIEIKFGDSIYIIESMFLGKHSPPKYTGLADRIHTAGFSQKIKYYYQLVIPLEKELSFHFTIDHTTFTSDLGFNSSCATTVTIKGDTIQACCISNDKKEYFLVLDSNTKQTWEEFSDKTHAIKIAIGYLSGYYAGDQGYFFAFTTKKMDTPKYFRCTQLRTSIKSVYNPVYANAYGYLHRNPAAKKYQELLRPVSIFEFTKLCERLHSSTDFASMLMLVLESSVASLLFMPGGFAIALETISDLIIDDKKTNLSPIKDKKVSREIRKAFIAVLDKYRLLIHSDDLKTLEIRIDQFNQITNKARLKAPFDLLNIDLLPEDLKILGTRNDFLHGRVPDLTNAGKDRTIERINKDLYYASMRFYTLLSMLILKWIGYDNRVVNHPKLQEGFTNILIDEEPFRQV